MKTRISKHAVVRVAVLSACLVAGTAVAHYGSIKVLKFYDANANGIRDAGEPGISGWPMWLQSTTHSVSSVQLTYSSGYRSWSSLPAGNDYSVTEAMPIEGNWVQSAPLDGEGKPINPQTGLTVTKGLTTYVRFGNYCTKRSGGRTPGFWSNKNGHAKMADGIDGVTAELALLSSLNLVDANGMAFNPENYGQFRTWLLGSTATNMAYKLSAHLAAMQLNVEAGYVKGNSYYPAFDGTINELMALANASLASDPFTPSGHAERAYQEQLKNHLDALNNGATVIPAKPCKRTFASS